MITNQFQSDSHAPRMLSQLCQSIALRHNAQQRRWYLLPFKLLGQVKTLQVKYVKDKMDPSSWGQIYWVHD